MVNKYCVYTRNKRYFKTLKEAVTYAEHYFKKTRELVDIRELKPAKSKNAE